MKLNSLFKAGTSLALLPVILASALTAIAHADAPAGDTGEHTYTTICQSCHMPNGEGAVGAGFYPKLAGDKALASWQYVAITVLNGRHAMPPFGTPKGANSAQDRRGSGLSDQQVADVVNYVRTHFGNTFKDKASAAEVAPLPHPGGGAEGGEHTH